jgi:6-phosphogluconolactonase (cycloisomerase 2 family)
VVTDQAQEAAMVIAFDAKVGTIGERKVKVANPSAQLSFPHGNAVSPDGRYLAVANYGDDKVTLYDLEAALRKRDRTRHST